MKRGLNCLQFILKGFKIKMCGYLLTYNTSTIRLNHYLYVRRAFVYLRSNELNQSISASFRVVAFEKKNRIIIEGL